MVSNEKFCFFLFFLVQFRPILAWKETKMMFFNCWIFLGIANHRSGKLGSERRKHFLPFSASPILFRLEMKPRWCFLNFFAIFFRIFLLVSGKNCSEWEYFFLYFSARTDPFRLVMMPRWSFLIFWIFLLFFWEFSSSGRHETDPTEKFFFSSLAFPNPFRLEMEQGWSFFNCLNLFSFFLGIF